MDKENLDPRRNEGWAAMRIPDRQARPKTGTLQIGGNGVLFYMGDSLLGKLIKELQKLGASQHSAPPPEKLPRFTDFTRW